MSFAHVNWHIHIGCSWSFYAIIPEKCYGDAFALGISVFDSVFDIFYALFPMIVAGGIDINNLDKTIGILQITSTLQFISTYVPFLLLLRKLDIGLKKASLMIKGSYISDYTHELKFDQLLQLSKNNISKHARGIVFKLKTKDSKTNQAKHGIKPTLISHNGAFSKESRNQCSNDEQYIKEFRKNQCYRVCLLICSILMTLASVIAASSVLFDVNIIDQYCSSFDLGYNYNYDQLSSNQFKSLIDNPELIVYNDICKIKAYHLFNDMPCNCRFVETYNRISFSDNDTFYDATNSSFGNIVTNIFEKWFMLEKVRIRTNQDVDYFDLNITDAKFFSAKNLIIVRLNGPIFHIKNNSLLRYMENWSNMISFHISRPLFDSTMTDDDIIFLMSKFGEYMPHLSNFELSVTSSIMQNTFIFPASWCNWKSTLVSTLTYFFPISQLNPCIYQFESLRIISLGFGSIKNVSLLSIFALQGIQHISLEYNDIEWNQLINELETSNYDYNEMNQIFNSKQLKNLFLQGNPLCDEYFEYKSTLSDVYANLTMLQSETMLIELIDQYSACTDACTSAAWQALCPAKYK